jgi:hypothetical protein
VPWQAAAAATAFRPAVAAATAAAAGAGAVRLLLRNEAARTATQASMQRIVAASNQVTCDWPGKGLYLSLHSAETSLLDVTGTERSQDNSKMLPTLLRGRAWDVRGVSAVIEQHRSPSHVLPRQQTARLHHFSKQRAYENMSIALTCSTA